MATPEPTAKPDPAGTQAPSDQDGGVLLEAIYSRNVELVETLVEAGFSVNAKDDEGKPLLYIAIIGVGAFFSSDVEASERIVQILVDTGADVNARVEGKTLLYWTVEWAGSAFYTDNMEAFNRVAQILLDAGAGYDTGTDGPTPTPTP